MNIIKIILKIHLTSKSKKFFLTKNNKFRLEIEN